MMRMASFVGMSDDALVKEWQKWWMSNDPKRAKMLSLVADALGPVEPDDWRSFIDQTRIEMWFINKHLTEIPIDEIADCEGELFIGCNLIEDLSPIKGLKITSLAAPFNKISDIGPVSTLFNLRSLWMGNNMITSIAPVFGLRNLVRIDFEKNSICDITGIEQMTSLKELRICGNKLTNAAIVHISQMASLETLAISSNQISNIDLLSKLVNLLHLSFEDNKISDISALATLAKLRLLKIGKNLINDVSVILKMPALMFFFAKENPLREVEKIIEQHMYLKDHVRDVHLSDDQI